MPYLSIIPRKIKYRTITYAIIPKNPKKLNIPIPIIPIKILKGNPKTKNSPLIFLNNQTNNAIGNIQSIIISPLRNYSKELLQCMIAS